MRYFSSGNIVAPSDKVIIGTPTIYLLLAAEMAAEISGQISGAGYQQTELTAEDIIWLLKSRFRTVLL